MIRSETAGGEYAVDVRMKQQSLIPGVEHAEEANLNTEMPGIVSDLEQSLSTGMKQQIIDYLLVLQGEWGQFARQGKDDMHVGGRQKVAARLEPAARAGLALGQCRLRHELYEMACTSAADASVKVSSQRRGAAAQNRQEHLLVMPVHPGAAVINKSLYCAANDVGHLQRGPPHQLC